jgi:hypothetical protein
MSGISESKQALLALVLLGKEISLAAKDGLDFSDLAGFVGKLVSDGKFRSVLEDGIKGIDATPSEIGDLDASEALEIVGLLIDALRK